MPRDGSDTGLELNSDSVFVVTGAAGSIVSAIVADLASASGGTFHLLDLAARPDADDPDIALFAPDRDGLKRTIFERIKDQNDGDEIVLYMKGSPAMPQCGFSQVSVEILKRTGKAFATYDVLQDPSLREGIKQYSNWPTIPQLYVKGEFVGGCDIIRSMYENGELDKLLEGVAAA